MTDRYSAHGPEAEFEPGSRGRVLRNLKGIQSVREMERCESKALLATTQHMIDITRDDQRFTSNDIRGMHRVWLSELYSWAGEYRQVNIAKGDFMFAAAAQVPLLMTTFERGPLREFTPCRFESPDDQFKALAVVHAELVLIHPFREGNGRSARLLSVLMGLQAGLPVLDFGGIKGDEKRRYIQAIHAALDRDYAPMTRIFHRVIDRTLQREAKA